MAVTTPSTSSQGPVQFTSNQFVVEPHTALTQSQQLQNELKRENFSSMVDDEIRVLRRELPPIDYGAAEQVEDDEVEDKRLLCTCTFREVTVMIDPVTGLELDEDAEHSDAKFEGADSKIAVNIIKREADEVEDDASDEIIADEDETDDEMDEAVDDEEPDDFCMVPETLPPVQLPAPVAPSQPKPKFKSIFDDDYEDEHDPVAALKSQSHASPNTRDQRAEPAAKRPEVEKLPMKFPQQTIKTEPAEAEQEEEKPKLEPFPLTKWVCDEDQECPAKLFYAGRDLITERHVDLLHNCFVAGINGNWNGLSRARDSLAPNPTFDYKYQFDQIDYERHGGLHRRVVPSYHFLYMDAIPKRVPSMAVRAPPTHTTSSSSNRNSNRKSHCDGVAPAAPSPPDVITISSSDEEEDEMPSLLAHIKTESNSHAPVAPEPTIIKGEPDDPDTRQNGALSSFSRLSADNATGINSDSDAEFREWHQLMNVKSYNDDILTILPYVVID